MIQIEKKSWLSALREGLSKTSTKVTQGIADILIKRKLDETVLEELEELLIAADLGPSTSARLVAAFGNERFGKNIEEDEVRSALAEQMASLLRPTAIPLVIDQNMKPFVILMVGVNGAGKTTTIGKMAARYVSEGKRVILAAGDTFRAAAIAQLEVWGGRAGCEVVAAAQGSDTAALVYRALEKSRAESADILMIDTAGRLHNKSDLMQELSKVVRVIKKLDPTAPHATLLVLDATTGQNAFAQVDTFKKMTQVTGLVLTKLDGSAKGGVVVGLADRFKLPIHAVGVGEKSEDLQPFDPDEFARALMGK